jgi:hypothetical protein
MLVPEDACGSTGESKARYLTLTVDVQPNLPGGIPRRKSKFA